MNYRIFLLGILISLRTSSIISSQEVAPEQPHPEYAELPQILQETITYLQAEGIAQTDLAELIAIQETIEQALSERVERKNSHVITELLQSYIYKAHKLMYSLSRK